MEQYISKSALVVVIERLKLDLSPRWEEEFDKGWNAALKEIERHINTFEVKEVDLEKSSISEQRIKHLIFEFWTGLQTFDTSWYSFADAYSQGIKDILKELGLKAQKGEKV